MSKKALVAMSGGVDSSVAAYLTKEMGYSPIGVTMKLFDNEDIGLVREKTCCSLEDIEDARSVAYKLDIPYYVFNFKANFKENVIDRFIEAYKTGATPNPCIDCNRYLKFEKLMQRASELDCDYVVTGHYGIIFYDEASKRYILKKSVDSSKDQSYVLYSLTQQQLSKTLLPLGSMTKDETRKIAEEMGFVNSKKKDSQDICFVPDGDYAKFIEEYSNTKFPCGDFVDTNGNVLGRHRGIIRYTIGQRKGLGLALPHPMYVKEKNVEENKVVLCDNEELFSKELYAKDINLITCDKIQRPVRLKAKVRYKQEEQWAIAEQVDKDRLHIVFEQPQRAISKGQAVVLYDGDIVVGGGTIE
ncbi:MAG: tRNA 2-thiouridine(34) synthase MnmA [Ruminococcus sp.]